MEEGRRGMEGEIDVVVVVGFRSPEHAHFRAPHSKAVATKMHRALDSQRPTMRRRNSRRRSQVETTLMVKGIGSCRRRS